MICTWPIRSWKITVVRFLHFKGRSSSSHQTELLGETDTQEDLDVGSRLRGSPVVKKLLQNVKLLRLIIPKPTEPANYRTVLSLFPSVTSIRLLRDLRGESSSVSLGNLFRPLQDLPLLQQISIDTELLDIPEQAYRSRLEEGLLVLMKVDKFPSLKKIVLLWDARKERINAFKSIFLLLRDLRYFLAFGNHQELLAHWPDMTVEMQVCNDEQRTRLANAADEDRCFLRMVVGVQDFITWDDRGGQLAKEMRRAIKDPNMPDDPQAIRRYALSLLVER